MYINDNFYDEMKLLQRKCLALQMEIINMKIENNEEYLRDIYSKKLEFIALYKAFELMAENVKENCHSDKDTLAFDILKFRLGFDRENIHDFLEVPRPLTYRKIATVLNFSCESSVRKRFNKLVYGSLKKASF